MPLYNEFAMAHDAERNGQYEGQGPDRGNVLDSFFLQELKRVPRICLFRAPFREANFFMMEVNRPGSDFARAMAENKVMAHKSPRDGGTKEEWPSSRARLRRSSGSGSVCAIR